jgi:hypothetical protein
MIIDNNNNTITTITFISTNLLADSKRLERAMEIGSKRLTPLAEPRSVITVDNWKDRRGDLK